MQDGMPSGGRYVCQSCGKPLVSQMAWRLPGQRGYRCKPCHLATVLRVPRRPNESAKPVTDTNPPAHRTAHDAKPRQDSKRWRWAPR